MQQDMSLITVLMAIFTAAGSQAEVAATDFAWTAAVPPTLRQAAIETHIAKLAALRCVRREPGSACVTARGLALIHATQWEQRKVA